MESESLREGDAVAGPAAAASLPRTSPGWKSPDWHRASYFIPPRFRSAALPGQVLVFYDPQYGLITDVVPCEDAHAQDCSLLKEALACISAFAIASWRTATSAPSRVFVRYSSYVGLFYHPAARIHALLRIEGKTPFGGPG